MILNGKHKTMKQLSQEILADILKTKRKEKGISQEQLSELTGINRAMIGRTERMDFIPSITQLENLSKVLEFDIDCVFVEDFKKQPFPYFALRNKSISKEESESVEHLYSMILALQQQLILADSFKND